VPCAADVARAAVGAGDLGAAAVVADPTARLGLWRPNPAWEVLPGPSGITLHCAVHGATITLSILDQLDTGTPLSAAADAVERWFRLLRPDARADRRDYCKVRDRDAIVLTTARGHGARAERTTLHVVPWQQAFAVLVCTAPASAWDELQRDFATAVQQIELEPGAVTPIAQEAPGVVARVDDAPAAAVPAPAAPSLPHVRVPKDQPAAGGR
jgi:hypothetical protein